MHVDHVDRPLVVLVRHMRTDKALSLQHVHNLLCRRSALRHEQCKAVILFQFLREDLHKKLLRSIPDHLAVSCVLLPRVNSRDKKDLPAALSPYQIR